MTVSAAPVAKGGLSELNNHKLGPGIHSWSIPAGETCPGASTLCHRGCYARRGFYRMPNVQAFHVANEVFSRHADFVPWMKAEISRQGARVMRIHCAGDFYDEPYTRKWVEIVKGSRRTQFFGYTRSWRVPEILPTLVQLSQLGNFSLWFSLDRETGSPPLIQGIRRAYMALNDADATTAPDDCDLVFRDLPHSPMKQANGVLVCPAENCVPGKLRHTCTTCGLCWDKQRRPAWEQALLPMLIGFTVGTPIRAPSL